MGILITDILQTSDSDTFPIYDPKYGIDGLRNVASIAERNAIPNLRRRAGMVVGVDNVYYRLKNVTWNGTNNDWQLFKDFDNAAFVEYNQVFSTFTISNEATNQSGLNNVLIGKTAGRQNSGSNNVIIGVSAGYNMTGGNNNAIGYYSQLYSTGIRNNSIGTSSLQHNYGNQNNAFGSEALKYTGENSQGLIAIGEKAAKGSDVNPVDFQNSVAIGANSNITASNQVSLGDGNMNQFRFGETVVLNKADLISGNILIAETVAGVTSLKSSAVINFNTINAAHAENNSIFRDAANPSKLSYKDDSGTVKVFLFE